MARMKPPKIPENLPPLRSEEELRRLVRACEGTGFADRRDMALVRLFLDCGARRAEIPDLKVQDIEFEQNVALVVGKGARPRACSFGKNCPSPGPVLAGPFPMPGRGVARVMVGPRWANDRFRGLSGSKRAGK